MAKALILAALLLTGCATAPREPWTISNPADKTGWERRRYCSPDALMCRGGFQVVTFKWTF